MMALDSSGVRWGLGRHFYYLTPIERVNSMKWEFLGQPVGTCVTRFPHSSFPTASSLMPIRYPVSYVRAHCIHGLPTTTHRHEKGFKMVPLFLDCATCSYQRCHNYPHLGTMPTIRNSMGSCRPPRQMLESCYSSRFWLFPRSDEHLDRYCPYHYASCHNVQSSDSTEVEDWVISVAWLEQFVG